MEAVGETRSDGAVVVWDLGVRLFHWLLVTAVGGAAWTGFFGTRQTLDIHLVCGVAIVALLVWRCLWGGLGSTYARFRSFVVRPRTLLHHLREMLSGRAPPHVGHNPLGGLMVLVLMLVLTALVVSGTMALGGAVKDGPLAAFMSYTTGVAARRIHELVAYGLLALVGAHVGGVLLESWRTRESLIGAMLTGRKPARGDAVGAVPAVGRPGLALVAVAALLIAAAGAIVQASLLPPLGVPVVALPPAYVKECSACHTPHHPSLAPAASWARILAGLDDHFGDNASLPSSTTVEFQAFLSANAAERWDSPAANRFRVPSDAEPLRITATAGWREIHRGVAESTFAAKAVGGRLNCANCHQDAASGRFAPRAILIP